MAPTALAGQELRETAAEPVPWTAESGLSEPRRLSASPPTYPEEARKQGIQGTVVLQALIGADGAVHRVKVLRPLPEGLADAAAEAVRRWTFEPARDAHGRAVPVLYTVAVRFTLDGGPAATSSTPKADLPEGWTPPRVKDAPPPAYPEEARRRHLQGTVRLELAIGADGTVKEVTALQGLPAGLTDAAVEAVRHWTFEPARDVEGRPVGITQVVGVRFRLDEGDEAAGR